MPVFVNHFKYSYGKRWDVSQLKLNCHFQVKKENCLFQVRQNINARSEKKGAFHMPETSGVWATSPGRRVSQSVLPIEGKVIL